VGPAGTRSPASPSWPLNDAFELRDSLLESYAAPSRSYHDTRHLSEVLARLDELAAHDTVLDRLPVELAAWFHHAIYDGPQGAEERSATWAQSSLDGLVAPNVVAEVLRLVRLTETHRPDDGDTNGCALSDADLAILAATAMSRTIARVNIVGRPFSQVTLRSGSATRLAAPPLHSPVVAA